MKSGSFHGELPLFIMFHGTTLPFFMATSAPGDFGGPNDSSQQPAAVRAPRGSHRAGREGGPGTAAAAAARGVASWTMMKRRFGVGDPQNPIWLVVWNHGILNDFPQKYWECHHPN